MRHHVLFLRYPWLSVTNPPMRLFCAVFLAICIAFLCSAQVGQVRPKFSDYPVHHIYKGAPAHPILTKNQWMFRTVIRDGSKHKVQFAGRYTVPEFGCGAGCSSFYIVDSIGGKVYDGFVVSDIPPTWIEENEKKGIRGIDHCEFHPNSRLLKINGCPNEKGCGFYDYEMVDGVGLKPVRRELLPKEFQP